MAKRGKQPDKDGITERTEPIILDHLTTMLGIGSLVLIGVISAVLWVLWDGPRKAVGHRLHASELNVQNTRHDVAFVESKPAILDPPAGPTSGYPSSIPTQEVVIKDGATGKGNPALSLEAKSTRF